MSLPMGDKLEELFLRYWDNTLTAGEAEELRQHLAADRVCRERFQFFCLQAVVAAELPAAVAPEVATPMPSGTVSVKAVPPWSRRRMLRYLGGGLAASVTAGLLGWRLWPRPFTGQVRLTGTGGTVAVYTAGGEPVPLTGSVPPGGTIFTYGPFARAILNYPDGTAIAVAGDSAVSLADDGQRLLLRQGSATANVPPRGDAASLTLATPEASLGHLSGVVMTLSRVLQVTEVGVQRGRVKVADPKGETLAELREGELLTVRADGDRHKWPMPVTPDDFTWDLARPLSSGWNVGHLETAPDGPVVRPDLWFDPYYKAKMYQVRSFSYWARGLFRLFPESVVKVRYWVDKPGPSQVSICVRGERPAESGTGVVECNGAFAKAQPSKWQWLTVKAQDMLDNANAPRFGPPWVGFLLIFNTYQADLGLKVADFRVTRSGGSKENA